MVSGRHLSLEDRYRIYVHSCARGKTADWLFVNLFLSDPSKCSPAYLVKLVRFFKRCIHLDDHASAVKYLVGGKRRGGRHQRLSEADDLAIEAIVKANPDLSDKEIAKLFGMMKVGDEDFIGTSLVFRARGRRSLVPLVFDRTSVFRDPAKEYMHHKIMANIHQDDVFNFDETYHGKGKWRRRCGKGKKGTRLKRKEWVVGGRRFSILALYCSRGFVFWHIIEGSVTHETIEAVFKMYLEPIVTPTSWLILDNACLMCLGAGPATGWP